MTLDRWDVAVKSTSLRDPIGNADPWTPRDIVGHNAITYRALADGREMQIDLMTPLVVDSMVQDGKPVTFRREGNAFFATLPAVQRKGTTTTITVYYHGLPQEAKRPPWEGGFTLADGFTRPPVDRDDRPGDGRQRLVAQQGHPGRRARLAACRDHGSQAAGQRLERTAAQRDAARRMAPRPTSGS